MRDFELSVLLKSDLDDEQVDAAVVQLSDAITKAGGTVGETKVWGKRPLAYPINNLEEAIYIFVPFASEPELPAELARMLRFNESVLRHLVVHAIPEPPVIQPRVMTKKTETFIPPKVAREQEARTREEAPARPEPAGPPAEFEPPKKGSDATPDETVDEATDGSGDEAAPVESGAEGPALEDRA